MKKVHDGLRILSMSWQQQKKKKKRLTNLPWIVLLRMILRAKDWPVDFNLISLTVAKVPTPRTWSVTVYSSSSFGWYRGPRLDEPSVNDDDDPGSASTTASFGTTDVAFVSFISEMAFVSSWALSCRVWFLNLSTIFIILGTSLSLSLRYWWLSDDSLTGDVEDPISLISENALGPVSWPVSSSIPTSSVSSTCK